MNNSNYYLGTSPTELLGSTPRYLYALRRNDEGELFYIIIDQLSDKDVNVEINAPGFVEENFPDFEPGLDYYEGIREDREREYANLIWTQIKWGNNSLFYYVNNEGQLVQRANKSFPYPSGISS
jgi:hypothetical protein